MNSNKLQLQPGLPNRGEADEEFGEQALAAAKIHDGISERHLTLEFSEAGALVLTLHDPSPKSYHLPIEDLFIEALRRADEDVDGLN